MIKLRQVATVYGETTLIFDVDGLAPDGSVTEVRIPASDLTERMKELKRLLGRDLTLNDLRDIIVALVNQMREGGKPLAERFNFAEYIGVDFEQQKEGAKQ
jgi:hypothetical protein